MNMPKTTLGKLSLALLAGAFSLGAWAELQNIRSLLPAALLFLSIVCAVAAWKTVWAKVSLGLVILFLGVAIFQYYTETWDIDIEHEGAVRRLLEQSDDGT